MVDVLWIALAALFFGMNVMFAVGCDRHGWRDLGVFGEPHVNVLLLNLARDTLKK
jgi:K+-transporting ATPase c subunit